MQSAATWMDPKIITVNEMRQDRKTNNISYHFYVESKKKKRMQMNLWNRNRLKTNLWLCCVRCAKSLQLCPKLFATLWTVAFRVPLSLEFSRKEY